MKTQMRVQKILMLVSLVVAALVFVYALFFLTGGLGYVYRYIDKNDGDVINCKNFVNTSQTFVSTLIAFGIVMVVLVAVMYLMACHSRRKYYVTNYVAIGAFVVFTLVVAIYLVAMVATTMNLYQNDINWKSGEGRLISRTIEIPGKYEEFEKYYPLYEYEYELDEEGNSIFKLDEAGNKIIILDENGEPKVIEENKKMYDQGRFSEDDFGNLLVDGVLEKVDYAYPRVHANYAEQAEYYPDYQLDPNQTYNFALGFVLFVIVFADAACVTLCAVWKFLLVKGEKKLLANGDASATKNDEEAQPQTAEVVEEVALDKNPVKEEE